MTYKISILTPVHISSGNKNACFLYHPDKNDHFNCYRIEDLLQFIPPQKLLELQPDNASNNGKKDIIKLFNNYVNYNQLKPQYFLFYKFKPFSKDVTEQVKSLNKPYIPGSSIKGAIMNAIIFNLLNDNKEKVFLERKESQFFLNTSCDFLKLPNNILAYWLTDNEKDILENAEKLESKMQIKQGLATGNNELFVRNWFEVDFNNIEFHAHDYKDFNNSKKLYAPYNKGGNFRKWYGNKENIIKFNNYNYSKLLESGNHLPSREYYFKRGITWSLIGNDNFAARISDGGFVFDVGGSSGFPKEDELEFYLAFLCSKVTVTFLKALNPTINFQVGDIKNLPIIYIDKEIKNKIIDLAKQCIINYKDDWDLSELSWDYKRDPLIPKNQNTDIYISEIYENYKKANSYFI